MTSDISKEPRDRPETELECEIEIAPEMIDAALARLIWFDTNTDDPRRIVEEILVTMGAERTEVGLLLRNKIA
jgi:hypothetical protein